MPGTRRRLKGLPPPIKKLGLPLLLSSSHQRGRSITRVSKRSSTSKLVSSLVFLPSVVKQKRFAYAAFSGAAIFLLEARKRESDLLLQKHFSCRAKCTKCPRRISAPNLLKNTAFLWQELLGASRHKSWPVFQQQLLFFMLPSALLRPRDGLYRANIIITDHRPVVYVTFTPKKSPGMAVSLVSPCNGQKVLLLLLCWT